MNLNEHRVREYAYYLWEAEGKPHGQATKHWEIACKLAKAEAEAETSSTTPGALSGQVAASTPNDKGAKTKKAKNGNGSAKKATQASSSASGSINTTKNAAPAKNGSAKSAPGRKAKDTQPAAQLADAEETFGQAHASFTTSSLSTAQPEGELPPELKKPRARKSRKLGE